MSLNIDRQGDGSVIVSCSGLEVRIFPPNTAPIQTGPEDTEQPVAGNGTAVPRPGNDTVVITQPIPSNGTVIAQWGPPPEDAATIPLIEELLAERLAELPQGTRTVVLDVPAKAGNPIDLEGVVRTTRAVLGEDIGIDLHFPTPE